MYEMVNLMQAAQAMYKRLADKDKDVQCFM